MPGSIFKKYHPKIIVFKKKTNTQKGPMATREGQAPSL